VVSLFLRLYKTKKERNSIRINSSLVSSCTSCQYSILFLFHIVRKIYTVLFDTVFRRLKFFIYWKFTQKLLFLYWVRPRDALVKNCIERWTHGEPFHWDDSVFPTITETPLHMTCFVPWWTTSCWKPFEVQV